VVGMAARSGPARARGPGVHAHVSAALLVQEHPSYNMAVNLVGHVGKVRARALLESSFAQFQADKGVVGLTPAAAPQQPRRSAATREAMT